MRKIVKGGLYRHFKGMYYYVLDVATHSETSEQFVVYQKLYDQRDLYVRPLDMFLSDVDQEKYPDVEQKERFKLMSGRDLGGPVEQKFFFFRYRQYLSCVAGR